VETGGHRVLPYSLPCWLSTASVNFTYNAPSICSPPAGPPQHATMQDASLSFLKKLLETPSPSGYERPIQDVVRAWARPLADEVRADRPGNVLAVLHSGGHPRIMLAGHCDQIALMVQYIDDSGYLFVQPIGGWDMQILLGQRLTVWTAGGPVPGVVSRKAPHLLTGEGRSKVPQFTDVWGGIGARGRKDATGVVTPGAPATL